MSWPSRCFPHPGSLVLDFTHHTAIRGGCEVEDEEPANFALQREGQDPHYSTPLSSEFRGRVDLLLLIDPAIALPAVGGPSGRRSPGTPKQ